MKTNTKDTPKHTKQNTPYKVKNWREYNAALKHRGSLTLWIPDDIAERWYADKGRETYTDDAIEMMASLKVVYRNAWRQTQGLAASVFAAADIPLDVPDYSTRLCCTNHTINASNTPIRTDRGVLTFSSAKVMLQRQWSPAFPRNEIH